MYMGEVSVSLNPKDWALNVPGYGGGIASTAPAAPSNPLTPSNQAVVQPGGLIGILSSLPGIVAQTGAAIQAQKIANLNYERLKAGQQPVGDVSDLYGGASIKKAVLYGSVGIGALIALSMVMRKK